MLDNTTMARQPRGLVKLNEEIFPGWIAFEVENTLAYEADTFRVTYAINALPKNRDIKWLSQQNSLLCEIFAGLPQSPSNPSIDDLSRLMLGHVDAVEVDPVAGTVALSGRDFTAYFIDIKVTGDWLNHTASDMATQLAKQHGLTARVAPTYDRIGREVFQNTVMLNDQSEWDVLTQLARLYQYQVYVKGHELHFAPPPKAAQPYVLQWQAPDGVQRAPRFAGMTLNLTRHLTVAQDITVMVQSFSPITKRQFTVQYPTRHATGTITPGHARPNRKVYRYILPLLTRQQALQFAQAKHQEITQHERRLSATLPADTQLAIRRPIQLTGTGTAFDQLYYPESIVHRLDREEGYCMQVSAKNRTVKAQQDATNT